jgi:hypothetical protein
MFLCIYMWLFICIHCASRIDCDPCPSFEESKIRRCDQVIKFFEFYKLEDPEHLFGEGKCPLTYYVPFTL